MLLGAAYCDDEYITKKLLTILGDADQYDEMVARKDAEQAARFVDLPVEGEGDE